MCLVSQCRATPTTLRGSLAFDEEQVPLPKGCVLEGVIWGMQVYNPLCHLQPTARIEVIEAFPYELLPISHISQHPPVDKIKLGCKAPLLQRIHHLEVTIANGVWCFDGIFVYADDMAVGVFLGYQELAHWHSSRQATLHLLDSLHLPSS